MVPTSVQLVLENGIPLQLPPPVMDSRSDEAGARQKPEHLAFG